jgi:hypothetical protein
MVIAKAYFHSLINVLIPPKGCRIGSCSQKHEPLGFTLQMWNLPTLVNRCAHEILSKNQ